MRYFNYGSFIYFPLIAAVLQIPLSGMSILAPAIATSYYIVFASSQKDMIYNDSLTGLHNRRRAMLFMEEKIPETSSSNPLAVFMQRTYPKRSKARRMHPTEKIVIDENAAQIVWRMFVMALSGVSCRQIAVTLNEEGIPTPATYCGWQMRHKGSYSGLWAGERISDMLRNETHIGNMVQGKSVKNSCKSEKCIRQDRSKWIVVENAHELLVDKGTFYKVGQSTTQRRTRVAAI